MNSSRRAPALLCAILAVLVATWPRAAVAQPSSSRLDEVVASHLSATNTPGAALAVLGDGELLHGREWGVDGNGDPITAETPFLWGSTAKPVTGLAILRLAEDGKLDLDAPVGDYLEWFRPTWRGEPASPTVAQLLTNTSGLSTDVDSGVTDRHDTRPDALGTVARELSDVELSARPGDGYVYVSANYLLLGALIEEVAGRGFADHLRDTLFEPLGMDTVIADAASAEKLPPGHRQFLGHAVSYRGAYDTSGVPYGYMGGSARDLGRFALAQLNGGELDGKRVLSPDGVAASHRGRAKSDIGQFGYGWSVGTLVGTDETMVWKSGAMPGYHSMIVLLPDHDRAVVVVQNTFTEPRALQLRNAAFDAARLSIGADPGPTLAPDYEMFALAWVAVAANILFGLFCCLTWYRLRHRRPQSRIRLRLTAWLFTGAAVPAALLLAVPSWLEVSLPQLLLYAPDFTYALITLSAAVPLTAVWRTWTTRRSR